MKNAQLRLGRLRYEIVGEKRRTSISVVLDRLVADVQGEPPTLGQAQMLSVLGADAEIAAIGAALAKNAHFIVEASGIQPQRVSLDAKPECFRGPVSVQGRNRSLRQLIAISQEWATSVTSATPTQVYLLDSSPEFVWTNLAYIYGLPARPEWASWFHQRLVEEHSIVPLFGIGCDPVLVKGDRDQFLSWLGQGVTTGVLQFPTENGPIVWPSLALKDVLTALAN